MKEQLFEVVRTLDSCANYLREIYEAGSIHPVADFTLGICAKYIEFTADFIQSVADGIADETPEVKN